MIHAPVASPLLPVRQNALSAPPSGIVEVFQYGRDKPGLMPLWVGEGDLSTPPFIAEAAARSLAEGETFYTYQTGWPSLRAAIADYVSRLYGRSYAAEKFFVTSGGMHALQIAITLTAGPGDEVLVPTPAWPNFVGALTVAGATPREVPMRFDEKGWQLPIEDIERAITPNTRAIVINSPSNPTGWVASTEELRAILDLARRHGLWIIADEIYGQFAFDAPRAPSFRDVMSEEDSILFVQTFSKNWAMTGWRLGWIELPQAAPPSLGETVVNLIQYSSSGTPTFIQRAGEIAIREGDALIREQVERARVNRDLLVQAFARAPRIRFTPPAGAFYLFFGVEGVADSRALAFRFIDEAKVGLAPGTAFGAAGQGYFRLCYLRKTADIAEAADRLVRMVAAL